MTGAPTELRGESAEPSAAGRIDASPSFLRALRGIWLFTWRTQLAYGRLPMKLAGLLVLPVLVFFTTLTAQNWLQRYSPLGNPATQADILSRRLARANAGLQPDQRKKVEQIFTEEFAQTEKDLGPIESSQSGNSVQQVRECYTRIGSRLKPVLDDKQLTQFHNFETRTLNFVEQRANEPRWSWTAPFYHWLVDFYFFVILPLTCVRACGALIRDELQGSTLGFLITRPLSRGRLLVLKYLAQTTWLQVVLLIETLLIFGVGGIRHIPDLGSLLLLFLPVQFLAVFAWSGLGTTLGLISSRYVALALVYGLVVEMGIGRIPTNINTLSLMRHLKMLLAHNPALQSLYDWTGGGALLPVGALIIATAIFIGLAVLLFTFREYHRAAEMPK